MSEMATGVFAMECVTSSSPPLTVVWMKDGQPLSNASTGLNFTAVGRGIIMQTVAASVALHMEIHDCSTMSGRIKGTDSSINSVLRTVGIYRTGRGFIEPESSAEGLT